MSFEAVAISLTPTRCIYELIRDKNRLLQVIGHLRFGKHCGFPLCCRLEFSIRAALQPGALLGILNNCHPSSPKYTGCESDFVHCKWHAFLGHKRQRHLTERDFREGERAAMSLRAALRQRGVGLRKGRAA